MNPDIRDALGKLAAAQDACRDAIRKANLQAARASLAGLRTKSLIAALDSARTIFKAAARHTKPKDR